MTLPATSPTVSVVIPTYRAGSYLREAVRSVLAQSLESFELVIVADGCDDDLADVEGSDARIRILRQANRGESVARNVGIRAARSDLVAFLDDDDRMLPGRLEAQLRAMRGHPEAACCHTQFRFIASDGSPRELGYAREVQYLDLLRGELGALMPTTMMRRSALQEVGLFDAALRTCQDVDLILRLAKDYRLAFLPEVLTEYRRHATNASRDTRLAGQVLASLIEKHRELAARTGDAVASAATEKGVRRMRRLESGGCIVQAREAWRSGERLRAVRLAIEASRLSPAESLGDLVGNRALFQWAPGRRSSSCPG